MNADMAHFLTELKILVYVSLDGTNESVVRRVRGPNVFDRAMEGVRFLQKEKAHFATVFCIMSLNLEDAVNFVGFSQDIGASFAAYIPIIPNKPHIFDLMPEKDLFKDVSLKVKEEAEKRSFEVHFWCTPFMQPFNSKYFRAFGCNPRTLDIDSEGNVALCDTYKFDSLGVNIKGRGFKDVMREYLEHPLSKELERMQGLSCKDCKHVDICKGGCWSRSYWKYGTFSERDPLCFW
jgi:radical SAM protein with 4Fe4S-binding SPASM domain